MVPEGVVCCDGLGRVVYLQVGTSPWKGVYVVFVEVVLGKGLWGLGLLECKLVLWEGSMTEVVGNMGTVVLVGRRLDVGKAFGEGSQVWEDMFAGRWCKHLWKMGIVEAPASIVWMWVDGIGAEVAVAGTSGDLLTGWMFAGCVETKRW